MSPLEDGDTSTSVLVYQRFFMGFLAKITIHFTENMHESRSWHVPIFPPRLRMLTLVFDNIDAWLQPAPENRAAFPLTFPSTKKTK